MNQEDDDSDKMTLGTKIEEFMFNLLRDYKGRDRNSEFARRVGTSGAMVSHWISDNKKPGAEYLAKFRELGCDLNWLLDENATKLIVRRGKNDEVFYVGEVTDANNYPLMKAEDIEAIATKAGQAVREEIIKYITNRGGDNERS